MPHPDIHEVRLRPPVLEVPPLVWIEPPGRPEGDAPAEPPRPHPAAEFRFEGRPPSVGHGWPSAAALCLLGAILAAVAGAVALALW